MSKGEILIIGKLLLTFVVLLGFPLWELYALRRDRSDAEPPDHAANGDARKGGEPTGN